MMTVGRAAGQAGRESYECWTVSVSSASLHRDRGFELRGKAGERTSSINLSRCLDAIATTSLCYAKLDRFQFASAIERNSHSKPTSQP